MVRAFGYCRHTAPGDGALTVRDQEKTIRAHCARLGLELAAVLVDDPGTARTNWLERPAGRDLAGRLGPGDHVVAASGLAVCTPARELLPVLQDWQARDITLHFATLPSLGDGAAAAAWEAGGSQRVAALERFCALDADARSQSVREGLEVARHAGRRHTRHAGYGRAWKKDRAGSSRAEADAGEQATIALIVDLRVSQKLSWYGIARQLLYQRVKTADGREWSEWRVRRAFISAMQRRSESPPAP